jgi:hypothetical protein
VALQALDYQRNLLRVKTHLASSSVQKHKAVGNLQDCTKGWQSPAVASESGQWW